MSDQFSRTGLLIGNEGLNRLKGARVAVFGLGGVGSFTCEALARSGVGSLHIIDNDTVSITNINRQLIALHSTVGLFKCDVMQTRIRDINPLCSVTSYKTFFLPENAHSFPFEEYDYVADCVDTVSAKIALAEKCAELNIPLISSMGTGNKLDPTLFKVADIFDTRVCPLAKVMRRELKKRGITSLRVVYSEEEPVKPDFGSGPDREDAELKGTSQRPAPGSISFVPSVAGLIMAGEIIRDLISQP